MNTPTLKIDTQGTLAGAATKVELNGVDISACLCGVTLRMAAREIVSATLEYRGAVSFDGGVGRLAFQPREGKTLVVEVPRAVETAANDDDQMVAHEGTLLERQEPVSDDPQAFRDLMWRRVPLNKEHRWLESHLRLRDTTALGEKSRSYEKVGSWSQLCIPVPDRLVWLLMRIRFGVKHALARLRAQVAQ